MTGHDIRREGSDSDICRAFNEHVSSAATCVPVFCNDVYDTNLAFTYCHRVVDENLRDEMRLRLMVLGEGVAHRYSVGLSYSDCEYVSLKSLLGVGSFKGVCFAWSEHERDGSGFTAGDVRLAVAFYAYYVREGDVTTIDYVHASPGVSNYYRQRPFLVSGPGDTVSGIVCAPIDAYRNTPARLAYTFGLQAPNSGVVHRKVNVPFTPALWVDLGELFGMEFEPNVPYTYGVEGPKGKGWLLIETARDFNLHHL
jgi:hypothetical protein